MYKVCLQVISGSQLKLPWHTSYKCQTDPLNCIKSLFILFFNLIFKKPIHSTLTLPACTVACISATCIISSLAPPAGSGVCCMFSSSFLSNLYIYLSGGLLSVKSSDVMCICFCKQHFKVVRLKKTLFLHQSTVVSNLKVTKFLLRDL